MRWSLRRTVDRVTRRPSPRGIFGKMGESLAERFLKKKGYEILERNFRCPLGEIDLIAKEAGELVFIEVKTRQTTSFGFPEEQITWRKQKKLEQLAQFYLKRYRKEEPCRIDVVSILFNQTGKCVVIEVIPDAVSL